MQRVDRLDVVRRRKAARGLHDLQASLEAAVGKPALDFAEGAVSDARGIGLDHRRVGARQLADHGTRIEAGDDTAIGAAFSHPLGGDGSDAALVIWIEKAPQEANGDTGHLLVEKSVHGRRDLMLVERDYRPPRRVDALGDAADQRARDDRIEMAVGERMDAVGAIVFRPSLLAPLDLQQVLEAARDDEAGFLATPREKRVKHGRRAVAEHLHLGEAVGRRDAASLERRFYGGEEAAGNIVGRGRRLADAEVAALIDEEGVGEGAPDIEVAERLFRLSGAGQRIAPFTHGRSDQRLAERLSPA